MPRTCSTRRYGRACVDAGGRGVRCAVVTCVAGWVGDTRGDGAAVAAGGDGVVGGFDVATAARGAGGEPPAHALTSARQTAAIHAPVLLTRSTLTGNAGQEVSDAAIARRGGADGAGARRRGLSGRQAVVTLRPDARGAGRDDHAGGRADAVCPPAEEEAFPRRARGRDAAARRVHL